MKKPYFLLVLSAMMIFTGCGSSESENQKDQTSRSSKNEKQNDQTISSNDESTTTKTIYGRWIDPTYYTHKHGDQIYTSDDPFAFVVQLDQSQYFNLQSSLSSDVYTSGSWAKTDEDDSIEYYTVYVDGNESVELEFDREKGSLLLKSLKNDFSIYYNDYSCKQEDPEAY